MDADSEVTLGDPVDERRPWEQAIEAADRLALAADRRNRADSIDARVEQIEATHNYRMWRGRVYQERPLEGQFDGQ